MKLDSNALNVLIDRKVIRFIAQPDKDGFSKAVIVNPLSHLYSLEKVSNFKPCNNITSNNVILGGVTKEYKAVRAYLNANQYKVFSVNYGDTNLNKINA